MRSTTRGCYARRPLPRFTHRGRYSGVAGYEVPREDTGLKRDTSRVRVLRMRGVAPVLPAVQETPAL